MFSLMGWLCVQDWYIGARRNAAWPYAREDIGRFEDTFLSHQRDFTQEQMNRKANRDYKGKCVKMSPVISSPARLLKIIRPTLAYISKETCNPKLVPCAVADVRVPMGQEQARLYAHFLNRSNIPCGNPLIRARKQIAYLRNICADPAGFEHGGPKVRSNFNPKQIAILDLVRQCLDRGDQVTVICARVGQSNAIEARLVEAGVRVSRIDSTMAVEKHSEQSNLFKTRRTQAMLMGIKCAVGHSYPACPNLVVGSLEYSYGSYWQAIGRVFRVNSIQPVSIWCVLLKDSIEETMRTTVATKKDSATICLHGERLPTDYHPVELSDVLAKAFDAFKCDGTESEVDCESKWPQIRDRLKAAAASALWTPTAF